jgi:hypothetical protein
MMILLNEIYLSKRKTFSVKYPFYNINLFTADLKGHTLKNIISEKTFYKARDLHVPVSDFLSGDLPRYSDLRDVLITSTFLPFPNIDKVKKRLMDLARTIKSPMGRSKPLYLSPDTNLIYLKFFSRYCPLIDTESEEKVTAIDFRIALSDTVKDEIDANIKFKYRASNINKMKKSFGHAQIVNQLFNCSARKTRVAKSAQNEIKLLFADLEAERAESGDFSGDKEERDRIIAKSYSRFEKERNGEVLLLTADEDMAYHAKNAGLLEEVLIIPHVMPQKGDIAPYSLVNLLFDCAITFGVIRLGGTGVTIFGEWKGKSYNDYALEHLNLAMEPESRIKGELDRDLRIADKIRGLI